MKHDHNNSPADPGPAWTVAVMLIAIITAYLLASSWDEEARLAHDCKMALGVWDAQEMQCKEQEKDHE